MRFDKQITINLGNYESLKIGINDAEYLEATQIACTAIRYMQMCRRLNPEV